MQNQLRRGYAQNIFSVLGFYFTIFTHNPLTLYRLYAIPYTLSPPLLYNGSMKTLLIGANGQLGSDINKVFSADSAYQLIPTVREELDITKTEDIQNALKKYSPEMIISTAAFHRVDVCENEPDKAYQVNALAISALAKICHAQNIILVHFSTDYVFGADKKRNRPYTEDDNPGPVNAYGISKLAGEYFVKYLSEKYFLIRTCGLYGIAGPAEKKGNFVDNIIAKSNEHKEISVVNDQILTPTYTLDLANNLKELLKTQNYGLYQFTLCPFR